MTFSLSVSAIAIFGLPSTYSTRIRQEGECGSCLIRVEYVDGKPKMAIALTEREKVKVREIGKITEEQIRDAEVNDIAPPYRLACQFIAREEEVIIHYTGEPGGA